MWIGDQFGKDKAEQISLLDVANIFSPTPETANVERPTNHIILGAKGSGKSTILRALTYSVWQKRKNYSHPRFIGVYVPIRYEDASYFRVAFEELQDSHLFEHFFIVSLLYQIASQLREADIDKEIIFNILLEYIAPKEKGDINDLSILALKFLKERDLCISAVKNNPTSFSSMIPKYTVELFSMSKIQYLASQFSTLLNRGNDIGADRLGVLIDSLDYYGGLISTILPLFESDCSYPLVIKTAARALDILDLTSTSKSRTLEVDRDFEIISLDRDPDNEDHINLLKNTICLRARHNSVDEISSLSEEEILNLLFNDSKDPEDLASFNSFSRLSSGNILQIILLLDESASIYKSAINKIPHTLEPIPRDSRLKAIYRESRKFWDLEIGVRLPSKKHEAKVFCECLVELAKGTIEKETILAPSFEFKSLPNEEKDLVASLLSSRVLVAQDNIVHKTLQSGFPYSGPIMIELNRIMLPVLGIHPFKGNQLIVDIKDFTKFYNKSLHETKPYLSPKSSISKSQLFLPDFLVFISMPFDKNKRNRTTILRKAINKIYQETTGKLGKDGISYIDIDYIPHVGSFRYDIPKYINESTYVVADISEIGCNVKQSGGVFYELGLTIGIKKPMALFYNHKDTNYNIPAFESKYIPNILSGQTIIVVNNKTNNFIESYRKIHEKLIGYQGYYDTPLDISKPVDPIDVAPFAYLSFQPRNVLAYEWFSEIINHIFPGLKIIKSKNWEADDVPTLFQTASKASFCIIDCTESINNYCIELGLCSSIDLRKTLEVFNSNLENRINPVSMYPGKRFAWTDMKGNDYRQLIEILTYLARSTNLGTHRV